LPRHRRVGRCADEVEAAAGDTRRPVAEADRGRADPGWAGRVDLAPRPRDPPGLDVADALRLRLPDAPATPPLRPDQRRAELAVREPAAPQRERPAVPAPRPAVAVVSPVDRLDRRRVDRTRF